MRRATQPSGGTRCGAGAGCSATKYQSLRGSRFDRLVAEDAHGPHVVRRHAQTEFFIIIVNLLVRIHLIIVMIRWTGLTPWDFEFPFPGSLTSTFLENVRGSGFDRLVAEDAHGPHVVRRRARTHALLARHLQWPSHAVLNAVLDLRTTT